MARHASRKNAGGQATRKNAPTRPQSKRNLDLPEINGAEKAAASIGASVPAPSAASASAPSSAPAPAAAPAPSSASAPMSSRGKGKGKPPLKRNPVRVINGFLALFVLILMLGHAFMGELSLAYPVPETLKFLVFVGIGAIGLHVVMSLITTILMFTSKERPASDAKKRHQYLKWVTGTLIVLAAGVHVVIMGTPAAALRADGMVPLALALMGLTAVFLCIHVYTAVRGFAHDLGLSPEARMPLRVLMVSLTASLCLALVVVLLFAT